MKLSYRIVVNMVIWCKRLLENIKGFLLSLNHNHKQPVNKRLGHLIIKKVSSATSAQKLPRAPLMLCPCYQQISPSWTK